MWMVEARQSSDWDHTAKLCAMIQAALSADKNLTADKFRKMVSDHHPFMNIKSKRQAPPKVPITVIRDLLCGQGQSKRNQSR